jgi:uncharacterized membrane-anchored protein YjiN (DUF445 family)
MRRTVFKVINGEMWVEEGSLPRIEIDGKFVREMVHEFLKSMGESRLETLGVEGQIEHQIEKRVADAVRTVCNTVTTSTLQHQVRQAIERLASKEISNLYSIDVQVTLARREVPA